VAEPVFPVLRSMAEDATAHATHMKGLRFTIPSAALRVKVVDPIDKLPMADRDAKSDLCAKSDLYEYMLSKIAGAGQNGQFRTPHHICRNNQLDFGYVHINVGFERPSASGLGV
jgi:type I restriction enzyme M protein